MTTSAASVGAPLPPFTRYEKFVIAVLSFIQFTIILDFMILSPLGAMLMPALSITPAQFGLVVSAYAFSAGISGLLAAGFADRFDRKRLLLFFYAGFVLGTLFCGLAPSYPLLLAARIVTGIFGGVLGSISFAIITDLFPLQSRGRVMGFVQSAFAASQVLGLPLGLYLATHWGWHAPFLLIVGVSAAVGLVIAGGLRPVTGHLAPAGAPRRAAFRHLADTLSSARHLRAFATVALLSTGGFMLMPFSSAFAVNNLKISLEQLPLVYLVTGAFSIFIGPMVGRLTDSWGRMRVFMLGTVITIAMVVLYTHLGETPMWGLMAVNVVLWVGITARMISSQATMSAVPVAAQRGSFMAVSSAVQQISGGLAAALAGVIVSEGPGGVIEHFETVGYVVSVAAVITWAMMTRIQKEAACS